MFINRFFPLKLWLHTPLLVICVYSIFIIIYNVFRNHNIGIYLPCIFICRAYFRHTSTHTSPKISQRFLSLDLLNMVPTKRDPLKVMVSGYFGRSRWRWPWKVRSWKKGLSGVRFVTWFAICTYLHSYDSNWFNIQFKWLTCKLDALY